MAKALSLAAVRKEILVKESTDSTWERDDTLITTATKSRQLLGYNVLFNKVVVLKILTDLGIEPFTHDSVWDYLGLVYSRATKKGEDKKHSPKGKRTGRREDLESEEDDESESADDEPDRRVEVSRAINQSSSRALLKMGWIRIPLNMYDEEIPVHVLDRAISVKEHIPEAKFYVVSFDPERANAQIAILDDPFLEVTVGSESYYIDVWDEPDFEAKL